MTQNYDVIVIGGGPGGSMASTLLAKSGHKVLLIERENFPRYHIGESLLSGTADLLKKIGVLDKIEKAGYIKKHGVTWIWGKERKPWTVYFKDALAVPYDYGYQVERGPFDKMLLDNAKENGVYVLEGHEVVDLIWKEQQLIGVSYKSRTNGTIKKAEAPWTIDASGQSGFITKRASKQIWDGKLKNMAIWSYWENVYKPEGIDEGNTFLPTFSDGWWWFIPLRDDITSIGAVIDRENYPQVQKKGLKEYYLQAVEKTPELAERLKNAEIVDEIRVTKDWSYMYDQFHGKGFVSIGDAACFIDPLLSTGVHLAMLSGYLATASLNTILEGNLFNNEEEKILEFYQKEYSREYTRLKDQIYFLYGGHKSPDSIFWHARKTIDLPTAQPKQAFVTLIAGAYEHRSWYRRFLNQLDVPVHLANLANGIFDGRKIGYDEISQNKLLIKSSNWEFQESYALDGLNLKKTNVLFSTKTGRSLPVNEYMNEILKLVDRGLNFSQIVNKISEGDIKKENAVKSVLNEGITHGVLVPQ